MYPRPKDFHTADRIGWVRVARVYSNVVSPPTMFAVLGLALSLNALPNLQGVVWGLTYGFWLSLAPILFVLYLLRTGRIAELHMTNKGERLLPYGVAVLCALIMLAITYALRAPLILRCMIIFNALELALLAIITTRWLISMHSAATTAVMAILWLVWGAYPALLVGIPLIASVAVVRVFLRRHTWGQVIAGWLLGVSLLYVLVPFGCFV